MKNTYDFLKACGTYYLATDDNGQPRVRPFGTVNIYDGKLYFQTGKVKDVSAQMKKNPKVEICGFTKGKWIRVTGTAVLDESIEAQKSMLNAYPSLADRYQPGDGNNEVWYLKNVRSVISSFTEKAVTECF